MQRSGPTHTLSGRNIEKKRRESNVINSDLDELLQSPQTKNVNKSGFQDRLMRSKQLNETSELVCISTALNKFTRKNPVTLSPSEALGTKNQCNYIRKFTPLGRYFGVAKGSNGMINPLMQSREGGQ